MTTAPAVIHAAVRVAAAAIFAACTPTGTRTRRWPVAARGCIKGGLRGRREPGALRSGSEMVERGFTFPSDTGRRRALNEAKGRG